MHSFVSNFSFNRNLSKNFLFPYLSCFSVSLTLPVLVLFYFCICETQRKTSKMKGSLQVIALRETGPGSENGYGFLGPWARFSTVTKCLRILKAVAKSQTL